MRFHRRVSLPIVAMLAVLAVLALAQCSSKNKSTNPVSREMDSRDLLLSATYSHQFSTAGTFPYHCVHHSSMHGMVIVSDSAAPGDTLMAVLIQNIAFQVTPVTIRTGGRVTWTNNDNVAHTVTSD